MASARRGHTDAPPQVCPHDRTPLQRALARDGALRLLDVAACALLLILGERHRWRMRRPYIADDHHRRPHQGLGHAVLSRPRLAPGERAPPSP